MGWVESRGQCASSWAAGAVPTFLFVYISFSVCAIAEALGREAQLAKQLFLNYTTN